MQKFVVAGALLIGIPAPKPHALGKAPGALLCERYCVLGTARNRKIRDCLFLTVRR